jgi:acetylornithine deacetylase/succinyl-diaminopimelate desuccinylase-like protein
MPAATDAYVQAHKERFLDELRDFLRIPSISTLPEYRGEIDRAADFVAQSLRTVGMEHIEVIPTGKHPLVYGEWMHAPGKPTVLCYGHYDVQPPDPVELWESPPFEPTIRSGNIYCRGAADDKGQMYMHIKAIEALRAVYGTLPVNVKFLIEGEEEVGGASISRFVGANPGKLKSDIALVSDTALYADGVPTLCIGLRGLVFLEVEAIGPKRDLHSGLYGGAAPNPIFGLIEMLSKAKDHHGHIQIPGIYDSVEPPGPAEKESWESLPFSEERFLKEEVGSISLTGETDCSVLERVWARPTFEVHGIAGGFASPGAKTVIPSKATAKISFRLVPKQDPQAIIAAFRQFVAANTPEGIHTEVRVLIASPATMVNPDHPAIALAAESFSEVFGQPTVFIRSGGSIPIVGDFSAHLGIPTVLMGFGLPDDGLHSPNEKYRLDNYYKGISTIAHFLARLGRSSWR